MELGPYPKGAFISTLLALHIDPQLSHRRCGIQEQRRMMKTVIMFYEGRKDAPFKNKIWCCITRRYYDKDKIRAVHIVPHALGPGLVDYILGRGSGLRLDTVDNCLLMHQDAEQSFRNGHFVLTPVDTSESPILRWRIQMANLEVKNNDLGKVTLGEVDGKEVLFKNKNRPSVRFLYYHFIMTLIVNKGYVQPGWLKYWIELTAGRPFAAMGPYMRDSMLLALVSGAGKWNAAENAKFLAGEGETFTEEQKLSKVQEVDVAQRALVAHGFENIEGDDESSSEGDDESSSEDDE